MESQFHLSIKCLAGERGSPKPQSSRLPLNFPFDHRRDQLRRYAQHVIGRLKDGVIASKADSPAAIDVDERYSLLGVVSSNPLSAPVKTQNEMQDRTSFQTSLFLHLASSSNAFTTLGWR